MSTSFQYPTILLNQKFTYKGQWEKQLLFLINIVALVPSKILETNWSKDQKKKFCYILFTFIAEENDLKVDYFWAKFNRSSWFWIDPSFKMQQLRVLTFVMQWV